jgi:hypothetical protein
MILHKHLSRSLTYAVIGTASFATGKYLPYALQDWRLRAYATPWRDASSWQDNFTASRGQYIDPYYLQYDLPPLDWDNMAEKPLLFAQYAMALDHCVDLDERGRGMWRSLTAPPTLPQRPALTFQDLVDPDRMARAADFLLGTWGVYDTNAHTQRLAQKMIFAIDTMLEREVPNAEAIQKFRQLGENLRVTFYLDQVWSQAPLPDTSRIVLSVRSR